MTQEAVPSLDPDEGSAVPDPSSPSNVVQIPCYCPNEPHDYDTVTLAQEVSIPLGTAAAYILQTATHTATTIGELSQVYLHYGVVGWSLVDEKGNPVSVNPDTVRAHLTYDHGGMEVAEAANVLYAPKVMRPLLARSAKSSSHGPTDDSTRLTNGSGPKRRRPSLPSSPTGTAGQASVVPAS